MGHSDLLNLCTIAMIKADLGIPVHTSSHTCRSIKAPFLSVGGFYYLNHSASHAGAVTSMGRGHHMIRDSPGSTSTR